MVSYCVEYALYIGEEKNIIYKKGQGIVLNEPSIIAHADDKPIAAGNSVLRFVNTAGKNSNIIFHSVVRHGYVQNLDMASIFLSAMFKKIGRITNCLVPTPSSLDANGVMDYKTAIMHASATDTTVVFIPQVITSAFELGYIPWQGDDPALSIVIEGDVADLAIISRGEIIDGGTINNLNLLEDAKQRLVRKYPNAKLYEGNRLSVIHGAGKLLSKEAVVQRIIELN